MTVSTAICAAARAADEKRDGARALNGVPLAHKVLFARAGRTISCATHPQLQQTGTGTADILQRLDAAGALDLGGLHLSEFAIGPAGWPEQYRYLQNPCDPSRVTGGSSSGSAAAVGYRLVFAALGTDTGGSSVSQPPFAALSVSGRRSAACRRAAVSPSPKVSTRSARSRALLVIAPCCSIRWPARRPARRSRPRAVRCRLFTPAPHRTPCANLAHPSGFTNCDKVRSWRVSEDSARVMFGRTLSLDRPGWDFSGPLPRYALSFLAVSAASLGSAILGLASPGAHNLFLFFVAIVVTAWYAGAGPGWLSVLFSALVVDYFFEHPLYRFEFGIEALSWFAAFTVCGAAANAMSLRRRRMEQTLRRTRDALEDRIRVRTRELQLLNEKLIEEMTERTRAEAALRQTQCELARAARIMTVAELTASIAHEINQPLAAVVSNGEAAQNWLRRSPPAIPEVAESIAAVVTAGVRAAEIITRIRRLITKAVPRQTTIDVNEFIGKVLALVRADLARRSIVVTCHLAPELPPIVGDRIQLQQMLFNLINNASDAMAEISDRKRELMIETRVRGEHAISITVSDSGNGFCNADTSKIFEAFYSTKQGGMGIGLSVCRTVAESHGGSIRAVARQPHGAILEVELPAGRRHEPG